jgi:FkbM family methyltransferase
LAKPSSRRPFEEKGLLAAAGKLLKPGDIFWDIGANSGLLSYQIARSRVAGEVHSFEPNPKMYKLASQAVLRFSHAKIYPYGLSDRDANFTLTVPSGHTTMGTLEPGSTQRSGISFQVSCRNGDDLVFKEGFNPPQIIKIDTEGHELSVLKGLARTISTYLPVIFFEHISLDLGSIKDLIPGLYSQYVVCDSTGELHPADAVHLGHNSVLMPAK